MKTVTILGFGPSGLTAAYAALTKGWKVNIINEQGLTKPTAASAGVYILHERMGLPLRQRLLTYHAFGGGAHDYALKVYGQVRDDVSFPDIPESGLAQGVYDSAQAIDMMYDIVMSAFPISFRRKLAGPMPVVEAAVRSISETDLYISTLPLNQFAPELCSSMPAWVTTGEAPADETYIMYNAHPQMEWYRASAAFGRFTLEFCQNPNISDARRVTKVAGLRDQLKVPKDWLLTGRFGRWEKGYLTHQVYNDVRAFLDG